MEKAKWWPWAWRCISGNYYLCCLNPCFYLTLVSLILFLVDTRSKSGIFQSIFLGERGLIFIILFCIFEHMKLIASQLFPENPEAGKLIATTITFFIASTSSIILISLFCAGAYALSLMFLFNNKTNLRMNGVGSVMNVKIWNSYQSLYYASWLRKERALYLNLSHSILRWYWRSIPCHVHKSFFYLLRNLAYYI